MRGASRGRLEAGEDAASRASCLASTCPGGRGSSSGPTTRLCHRLAGRGTGECGEIPQDGERNSLAPLPGSAIPPAHKSPRWSAGRRCRGLCSPPFRRSRCGNKIQGAPPGAPSPLTVRGVKTESTTRRIRVRECGGVRDKQGLAPGCLKIESETRPRHSGREFCAKLTCQFCR